MKLKFSCFFPFFKNLFSKQIIGQLNLIDRGASWGIITCRKSNISGGYPVIMPRTKHQWMKCHWFLCFGFGGWGFGVEESIFCIGVLGVGVLSRDHIRWHAIFSGRAEIITIYFLWTWLHLLHINPLVNIRPLKSTLVSKRTYLEIFSKQIQ